MFEQPLPDKGTSWHWLWKTQKSLLPEANFATILKQIMFRNKTLDPFMKAVSPCVS